MNNYFVDTHCHVFKSDYENIDEVLENASNNHIKYVINNGSNDESNKEVLELVENIRVCMVQLVFIQKM